MNNQLATFSLTKSTRSYSTDTGNRDLGKSRSYPNETTEHEVINHAVKLAIRYNSKVVVIIRTSKWRNYPGAWYIKGYDGTSTYKDIKRTLEDNQRDRKFIRRQCLLIKLK